MVRRLKSSASASFVVALGLGSASPALAALPPYWQSAREIEAILGDQAVHDALKYEEPILSISTTGDDVYLLKTPRCSLTITVVDDPDAKPMPGPRQFNLQIGQADCQ